MSVKPLYKVIQDFYNSFNCLAEIAVDEQVCPTVPTWKQEEDICVTGWQENFEREWYSYIASKPMFNIYI